MEHFTANSDRQTLADRTPNRFRVRLPDSGGAKDVKKLPTFPAQSARRSEQNGPDQHQTSRRLHLRHSVHIPKLGY
ncbi:hypothetical protein GOODEAATRI_017994, partial [Goodea atripinnis]